MATSNPKLAQAIRLGCLTLVATAYVAAMTMRRPKEGESEQRAVVDILMVVGEGERVKGKSAAEVVVGGVVEPGETAFYVDPAKGDDVGGTGEMARPFKTIGRCLQKAHPVVLVLREGKHVFSPDNELEDVLLTLKPYPREEVEIEFRNNFIHLLNETSSKKARYTPPSIDSSSLPTAFVDPSSSVAAPSGTSTHPFRSIKRCMAGPHPTTLTLLPGEHYFKGVDIPDEALTLKPVKGERVIIRYITSRKNTMPPVPVVAPTK